MANGIMTTKDGEILVDGSGNIVWSAADFEACQVCPVPTECYENGLGAVWPTTLYLKHNGVTLTLTKPSELYCTEGSPGFAYWFLQEDVDPGPCETSGCYVPYGMAWVVYNISNYAWDCGYECWDGPPESYGNFCDGIQAYKYCGNTPLGTYSGDGTTIEISETS